MKIKREKLIELARRETERRASTGDVISGYIIGSVARNQPMLGGTADIDLVLIHQDQPPKKHEIVRLSDQIHLDIRHHPRDVYAKPSELRIHPWLGPAMCEPIFLYDPQHFFEWAQAGARGQYFRSDHVYARARGFLKQAKQLRAMLTISNRWIKTYAQAVLEAANAAACLAGFPVAGRRLVLDLEQASNKLNHPQVFLGFQNMIAGTILDDQNLAGWLSSWSQAYTLAGEISSDPEFIACRQSYYLSGFQALNKDGHPSAILWTLLTTWERAINALMEAGKAAPYIPSWETYLERSRLSPARVAARGMELEHYIHHMEELVGVWAKRNGA